MSTKVTQFLSVFRFYGAMAGMKTSLQDNMPTLMPTSQEKDWTIATDNVRGGGASGVPGGKGGLSIIQAQIVPFALVPNPLCISPHLAIK